MIRRNRALPRGDNFGGAGGVFDLDGAATFSGNLVEDNEGGFGGGIGFASPRLAEGNIIRRNKGVHGAGGVEARRGVWINNVICDNTTKTGEAAGFSVAWNASDFLGKPRPFHFVGNIVANNTGGKTGGMYLGIVFAQPGAVFAFSNCIFSRNMGSQADDLTVDLYSSTPGWTPTHSILEGYPGDGNMDVDPLFVDAERGDFRLREDSPAIDAGAAFPSFYQDFAGAPRPFRALLWGRRGDGSGVDIGAFEYQTAIPAPLPAAGNAWVMR